MEPALRADHVVAPRIRGQGRSTPRPDWSVFCSYVQRTTFRFASQHAGTGVPHVAAAGCATAPDAARCDDTQKPAATQGGGVAVGRTVRGGFQTVIDETDALDPKAVKRVVLCAGKVFYDLRASRRDRGIEDIAIVRIEQMYPFPRFDLQAVLARYPTLKMQCGFRRSQKPGYLVRDAESYGHSGAQRKVDVYLRYVGREPSASAAAGYSALHLREQEEFIDEALGPMPWGF